VPIEVPIDPPVDIYAVFQRFNYKHWTALAEFVDNSVQSFRDNQAVLAAAPFRQKFVTVRITLHRESRQIVIMDDAAGIPASQFPRAFRAAVPPSDATGLHEFGMGMKCAAFWFTKKWKVDTAHVSEGLRRTVLLDLTRIRETQSTRIPVDERPVDLHDHGTTIRLEDVDERMPRGGPTMAKVREFLADIYRVPIREGLLRLEVNGEECTTKRNEVLVAPSFNSNSKPQGDPIAWSKDISIKLPGDRKVTGFAGLFAKGKRSEAGFTLFRRGRVVEGFPSDRWKPEEIFGAGNSAESMLVFGELHFEGFGVSSQKDQIDWCGLDEDFIAKLKTQMNTEPMRLLSQARNYRKSPLDELDPETFEAEIGPAVESTGNALGELGPSLTDEAPSGVLPEDEAIAGPAVPAITDVRAMTREYQIRFDNADWTVEFQFPRKNEREAWLDVRGGASDIEDSDGRNLLQIRLAMDHPFTVNFMKIDQQHVEPVLRLAASLALAERLAKLAGVDTPSVIRSRLNQILTQALGHPKGQR
jgi:hypothetical protein